MRYVILTQYYPPETGAPQNRLSDLASRLHEMGHEVVVLTALPNYPLGRIHPEYRGHLCKVMHAFGITIYHCWIYPTRSKSLLLRLASYFSFVLSSAILGIFLLPRTDVIFVESPPIFLGFSAWWLSKLKRARVIFNVSDLYPETAISLGYLQNRWLQKIFFRFEAWCYSISAMVTGQTQGIVNSIRRRFPAMPVYLLTNGVNLEQFPQEDVNWVEAGDDGAPIVGYAGILGYAQNLASVLDAAAILKRISPGTKFVFYGDGPLREDLIRQKAHFNLDKVSIAGHLTHGEIIKTMRSWQAGIVPLVNAPLMAGALPSKLFEVMASGRPVVLYAPQGEASELILRAEAGIWIGPDQPQALAEAIAKLVQDPLRCEALGKNGREFVVKHYNRGKIARGFTRAVEELGDGGPRDLRFLAIAVKPLGPPVVG
jgi:glycosyltransferase involved in cell wall biosynthesis